MSIQEVVIVSHARTPVGSFRGGLSQISATELGSIAIAGAIERAGISKDAINEVYMGCVLPSNVGQAPARQASIKAGLSVSIPCTTVNKVCASGMKAIILAAQSLMLGNQEVIVAGGMESMSNVPYYLERGENRYGEINLKDGILQDGLTDAFGNGHMGDCAEGVAEQFKLSREDQDACCITSFQRTLAAAKSGFLKEEIVPVTVPGKRGPDVIVTADEEYSRFNAEKLKTLKPVFKKDGTVTAATASSLSDGAAACVLTTKTAAKSLGLTPLAKVIAFADGAVEPQNFPIAISAAITKVLQKTGLEKEDISFWELNEAFSLVSLANIKKLNLDPEKVNVYGGTVSLGHPLATSSARIVGRLIRCLSKGQKGIASACNGGGGASAILIEKL